MVIVLLTPQRPFFAETDATQQLSRLPNTCAWMSNETEQIVLAIVPKVTGAIGTISGIILLIDIFRSHRQNKGNPILRALGAASFFYMLDAFAWFLSSWVAPEGSFVFAHGNQSSCAFQGFWLQAVIASPLYITAMTYFYYLVACHSWEDGKLEGIELTVHGLVLGFALGTSIVLLILGQYNHIGAVCWVNGSPAGCGHSTYTEGDFACDRGDYAWLFGLFTFYTPLWICVVSMLFLNLAIYYNLSSKGASVEASWVANQAKLFCVAFVVTWAPSTVWSAMHYKSGPIFVLDLMAAVCEPLGGFFNLVIFLQDRPRLRRQLWEIAHFRCPTASARATSSETSNEP